MPVRALVVDPSAPAAVRLAEVPDPVPGPGQVLVAVSHASLNYGDLNDARSGRVPVGAVLGSDAAGVVVEAAADGTGPAVGTRVVALTSGAFAERVAIDGGALAEVPEGLDLAEAAALPVAGVAALRSLRAAGLGPDKRVLVTGASGGVGRFAVQLAARAGAHVIASVGSAARGEGLTRLGADEVLVGLDGLRAPRRRGRRQRRRPPAGRRVEPARPPGAACRASAGRPGSPRSSRRTRPSARPSR
ncbi:hypothetical protein GCM10020295_76730 [Streptomyces cinereospinus]